MSDKSCDNCQLKECDLSDCMSRGCGGGPTYPGHLPVKVACPLPRIGSKDWGWERVIGYEWFKSANTEYQISWYARKWCVVDGMGYGFRIVFRSNSVATCKRIAELLARRDWRRENRGKNG